MKIGKISCTQFAGMRDFEITFGEGVNVIYGKNESGKSTIVNLLSRTLFQRARLDGRTDRDFTANYFPCALKNGARAGDFADGKISFETEKGVYTLTKEWGKDFRCMLSTPEGVIRDPDAVEECLRGLLVYGEGVYEDILLTTQKASAHALQTLLDASGTDSKREIADAVTRAFAESDGISVDSKGRAIAAKVDELAGKHWDFERNMPVRKAGVWTKETGIVHKAYYELEKCKKVLADIRELEKDFDRAVAVFEAKDAEARAAESAYSELSRYSNILAVIKERREKIVRLQADLEKCGKILAQWPLLKERTAKAQALLAEKQNRELKDKFETAEKLYFETAALTAAQKNVLCPTQAEINEAKAAVKNSEALENLLCGMNVAASVRVLGDNAVEIKSLRTGKIFKPADSVALTEEVKITVPDVFEMQLYPADVDVAETEKRLDVQRAFIKDVLSKYKAESVDELEERVKVCSENLRRLDLLNEKLAYVTGGIAFEELRREAEKLPKNIRKREEIEREIFEVCGGTDIARFIAANEAVEESYIKEYGDIAALKERTEKISHELQEAQALVESAGKIPREYLGISDPEAYLSGMRNDLTQKRKAREDALTAKTESSGKLQSFKENIEGDPEENVRTAERAFEEQKNLLDHWLHISKVFEGLKKSLAGNPMRGLAESFSGYLNIISGGRDFSEFPENDKLKMDIYSGGRLLDYGKMSEGAKESVSLAFRLAVLDHLFPEGGGVIVFDDPLTDMDADRTARACKLINECAKRHQVIFLTCKQEYLNLLDGGRKNL